MSKEYLGIKFVLAEPMLAEDAKQKGYRVDSASQDGYEVTYEEGYKSWCPKDVFEKHNFEVTNRELALTSMKMVSKDYKQRFIAEFEQLSNRFKGLVKMLDSWDKGTLTFTPTCTRETYDVQLKAMWDYMNALIERAATEAIEINIPSEFVTTQSLGTFGAAIESLKLGFKVARKGWNGKGMYLWLKPATTVKSEWCKDCALKEAADANGGEIEALGTICMKTADNKVLTGWLASQTDILATDWFVVEPK